MAKKKRAPSEKSLAIAREVFGVLMTTPFPTPIWEGWFTKTPADYAAIKAGGMKLVRAIEAAAKELARILDETEEAEMKSSEVRARLTHLTYDALGIEQKIARAEATKVRAEAELVSAMLFREQLERALAELRAYPTAKVETWTKARQEMDPEPLPRFVEPLARNR